MDARERQNILDWLHAKILRYEVLVTKSHDISVNSTRVKEVCK